MAYKLLKPWLTGAGSKQLDFRGRAGLGPHPNPGFQNL